MRVRPQLSLTSVALVLPPGLLLGGLCAFVMLRQADASANQAVGELQGIARELDTAAARFRT